MITGILGGIMGPITEEAAVIAAEKSRGYPLFSISGMKTRPMAEVSATAEPDSPAKITEAQILTKARPARNRPTITLVKAMIRLGDARFIHKLTGENEQGNGQQRIGPYPAEHLGGNDTKVVGELADRHEIHQGCNNGKGNRHTDN